MTKPHPSEDPRRHCLMVEHWPAADRRAWEQALQPGDLLDGTVGRGFYWAEQTREKYRKGYGRWLTFLTVSGRLDPSAAPASRITPDAVQAYIAELSSIVSSWTLWGRLAELLAVAKIMAPGVDWSWLRGAVRYYETNSKVSRDKLPRLRPSGEISAWAFKRMDELIAHRISVRHCDSHYRDALAIALLIYCPTMRLGNLAMIEIGKHLIRMTDGYRLSFAPKETKTRKPFAIPIPSSLTPYIEHYLDRVRPALLGSTESLRLWITRYGQPMTGKALHLGITKATKRAFGRSINPHLFRDCAVTTVALEDPTHIGIAAPILGHTDPRTTEAHYIQANAIVAGRRLGQSIDTLRKQNRPTHHKRHHGGRSQ